RTLISDNGSSGGPTFPSPLDGMALDPGGNRALVTGYSGDGVFAVDLTSGEHSIVTDASIAGEPELSFPRSLAVDSTRNRALVVDVALHSVVAVELASGMRSTFSGDGEGDGTPFVGPTHVAVDELDDRAWVVDGDA